MKRSEMILKIMEAMVEAPDDMEKAADRLLTAIEKAGMQAPNIKYRELFPNSLLENTEEHWFALWEPEDETK